MNRARVATLLFALWIGALGWTPPVSVRLAVPIVRQPPSLSGPATLEMVLRYYGADSVVAKRSRQAFSPAWGSAQLESLAATSRRLGYPARIATPGVDSIVPFLRQGVPPILGLEGLDDPAVDARLGGVHYFVVTRWDSLGNRFFLQNGAPRPLEMPAAILSELWQHDGARVLLVARRPPRRAR